MKKLSFQRVEFHKVAVAPPGNPIQIGKDGIGKFKTRSNSRIKRGSRFEMRRKMESCVRGIRMNRVRSTAEEVVDEK